MLHNQLTQTLGLNILVLLFSGLLITSCGNRTGDQKTTAQPDSFNNGTKVVRGVNACPLNAEKIGAGNNPRVSKNEPLTDLSVNASSDRKVTYEELAAKLPAGQSYAFTTLGELRKANKFIQIVSDPVAGNPYHCLISVITPAEMASKMGNCR